MTWVRHALWFLPWVLLVVATVFLSLGLSWRHVSDADTVNGAFLIVALVLGALALCTLCVREMPELHKEKEPQPVQQAPPENAQLPLVTV